MAFFKQENCSNKMASENVAFQNLLKIRKLLPPKKFGNIFWYFDMKTMTMTFDKES